MSRLSEDIEESKTLIAKHDQWERVDDALIEKFDAVSDERVDSAKVRFLLRRMVEYLSDDGCFVGRDRRRL